MVNVRVGQNHKIELTGRNRESSQIFVACLSASLKHPIINHKAVVNPTCFAADEVFGAGDLLACAKELDMHKKFRDIGGAI
jgi:hypothetical protein